MENRYLMYNLKLFDGILDELQSDKIIVVNGCKFEQIADIKQKEQFKDCRQIDMNGMTVLPGLIDMHVHISHFQYTNPFKPSALLGLDKQRKLNLKTA